MLQNSTASLEGLCQRDRLNARALGRWTFVWAITFVAAHLLLGPSAAVPPWLYGLVVPPLAAGIMMIRAYLRFLRHADELIRSVLLRAAAVGFGVVFALGIVFSLASQIFGQWEDAGEISWVVGFCAYQFSFLREWKKYDVQPSA